MPGGGQRVEAHQLAARDHRVEHPPERLGQQDQVHEVRPAPRASSAAGWPPRRSSCPRARARTRAARPRTGCAWRRATTGSSTSSTRITCAPLGRTQVRSGCVPCCHALAHRVRIGRALGQQRGGEGARGACSCRCRPGRGTGRRARAPPVERRGQHHPRLRVVLGAGAGRRRSRSRPAARGLHRGQHLGVDRCAGRPRVASMRRQRPGSAAASALVGLGHGCAAGPAPRPRSGRASPARCGRVGRVELEQEGQVGHEPPVAKRLMRSTSSTPRPRALALVGERASRGSDPRRPRGPPRAPGGSPRPPARRGRPRTGAPRRAALERERGVLEQVADPLAEPRSRPARARRARRRRAPRTSSRACVVLPERSIPSKVTNRPGMRGDRSSGAGAVGRDGYAAAIPLPSRLHACSRHRRRRLHRLEPRGRPGRAGRRGDRARQHLDRPAREPRARRSRPARSWSRSTSATPRRCAAWSSAARPEVDLPPGRPDRRAQVRGRPGLRLRA